MRLSPVSTQTRHTERLIRRELRRGTVNAASSDAPAGEVVGGVLLRYFRLGVSALGGPDVLAPDRAGG